jgi:hypothetical protein
MPALSISRGSLGGGGLTSEQTMNYVPFMFRPKGDAFMIRAVVEEAAALASITLFVGMIVVWAQVLAVL